MLRAGSGTSARGRIPARAEAGVDSNPNAELFAQPAICPDADLNFGAVWTPTPQSPTGHDLDGNVVGVAKTPYPVAEVGSEFTPAATIFERPGRGLGDLTVFCYWAVPLQVSPTGFLGGDILFDADLRP